MINFTSLLTSYMSIDNDVISNTELENLVLSARSVIQGNDIESLEQEWLTHVVLAGTQKKLIQQRLTAGDRGLEIFPDDVFKSHEKAFKLFGVIQDEVSDKVSPLNTSCMENYVLLNDLWQSLSEPLLDAAEPSTKGIADLRNIEERLIDAEAFISIKHERHESFVSRLENIRSLIAEFEKIMQPTKDNKGFFSKLFE